MAAKKKSYLDQIFAASDAVKAKDVAYKPMPEDSGGGGIQGTFGSIGKNLLNTLSVPQAALFTLIQKGGHAVAPSSVSDASWKNLVGGFRGKGYRGGAGLLTGFGVDDKSARKWGGLALDIVADPLNIVGGGLIAKGAKGARSASSADDIFKSAKPVSEGRRVLSKEERTALGKALTSRVPAISLTGDKTQVARTLRKAQKNKKRTSGLKGVLDEHSYLETLQQAIAKAVKQHKKVKPLREEAAQIERGLRKDALSRIFPTDARPAEFLPRVIEQGPKYKRMDKKRRSLFAQTVKQPLPGRDPGKVLDEAGILTGAKGGYESLGRSLREQATRGATHNYSFDIGIGKWKKKFDTGRQAGKAADLTSDVARHYFKLNPAQKIAFGLRRSTRDLGEGAVTALGRYGDELGLNKADSYTIYNVGLVQRADAAEGLKLKEELRAAGQWSDKHDQALDYILKSGRQLAKDEGVKLEADILKKKQVTLEKLQERLAQTSDPAKKNKIENKIDQLNLEIQPLLGRGDYIHQMPNEQTMKQYEQALRDAGRSGEIKPGMEYDPNRISSTNPEVAKQFHPVSSTTEADYRGQMAQSGMEAGQIDFLAERVGQILGFAETPALMKHGGVKYVPEWDAFMVHGDRMKGHYAKLAEQEIDKLIREGVPAHVFKGFNVSGAPGAIGAGDKGYRLQQGIAYMKLIFTTINPSHYVNNVAGDYINRMVNGNVRHLGTKAYLPKSQIRKLSTEDQNALKATFKIGDKDYTGAELLAISRLAGLGRGYVGTDINDMVNILHHGKNPMAVMGRFNLNRENAQRLETWAKHMRAGDDPFSAAAKTLRVHFDYAQLTDFERVWMRNLLLFYTWLKRNSLLHASGMLTRPGLYQAYGDIERNREAYANEPEYYGKQGAITLPGIGNLFFANPMNDIYKWDLSQQGLRQNILSAITPPARIPLEILSNKNFFTGANIEAYTDQKKPYWLAALLGSQTTVDGKPAMDAQLIHVLSSILGPQATNAQTVYDKDPGALNSVLRFLGLPRPQVNDPEKFAEQAKARETRKKADATRKRNKEE